MNEENQTIDGAGNTIRPVFKGEESCPHFESLLKVVFEQKPVAL